MKRFLLLLLCALTLPLPAEIKLLKIHSIQDLSPVFKVRPPDPDNRRLKDGNLKNISWWSVNIRQNPAAVLDIQLEQPAEVSRIVLHFYSHDPKKGKNGAWQPTLVELYSEGPNGSDVPIQLIDTFPELNKRYMPYTISLKNIRSRRFKLRMVARRNLGLTEIQFYGKSAAPAVKKQSATNLFSSAVPKGAQLRTADIDGDGQKEYLLENAHALYVISAANGGTVDYAALRSTRKNFVKQRLNDSHGGAFGEVFRFGNMAAMWKLYRSEYKVKVLSNTPSAVTVKFEYDHGRNMPGPLVYAKTYTLKADSAALKCLHSITNDGVNMVPWDEPFRLHSFLGNAAGGNRLFYQTLSGMKLQSVTGEMTVNDPVSAMAGIVDPRGSGMALISDYKHLESLIFWGSKTSGHQFFTVETPQGKRPVGPERTETILNYLVPFKNITAPAVALPEGVGGFTLSGKKLSFSFFPAEKGKLTFRAKTVSGARKIASGALSSPSVLLTSSWNGESVEIELFKNGRSIGKGWFRGKDGLKLAPPHRTVILVSKPEKENLDLNFIDATRQGGPEARISGHLLGAPVIWFAGNKFYWAREVPEFIRRYGIKATVFPLGGTWRMGDNPKQLYAAQSEKRFHDAIDVKDPKFDLLAINGVSWRALSKKRQQHILDLVKKGKGLYIWGEPAVSKYKTPAVMARPVSARPHPVVDGTLWEFMPDSLLFDVKAEKDEMPVIVSQKGKKNILTLQKYGKGRIVRSYWNTRYFPNAKDGRYNSSGFSPRMQEFYHWAILPQVKALFWAAGKLPENTVRINRSERIRNKLFFEAAAPLPKGTASLDLHFFDSCGGKAEPAQFKVPFVSGKCSVLLPKDAHTLFAVLRNKGGKILWWGGSIIADKEAVKLSFAPDREFYSPSDNMEIVLKSSRKVPVQITLTDSFGRRFAEKRSVAPGKLLIPMKNALGTAVQVSVDALGSDGHVTARKEQYVYLTTRTDMNDFAVDIAWMWVNIHGFPAPLMPSFWKELKKIGINTSSHFNVDGQNAGMIYSARRAGLPTPTMNERTSPGASAPAFKKVMNAKNKFEWIKRFCSNDRDFQRTFKTYSPQFHKLEKAGLISGRMGPDELGSHAGTWDGCFCKGCQKAFREYARKRYKTLEKLNAVWGTSYTDWDSIIADTLPEAKKRGRFACWIDHREAQEDFLAHGIGLLENNLRKRDPKAFYALSGTQDMTPFRAVNWQKLMKHQHGLYSYVRFQTNQQRSFIAPGERIFWLQWIGYNRPLNEHTRRLAWHMAMGGAGAAVYSYYYVKPDLVPIKASVPLAGALRYWSSGAGAAMIATRDSRPGVTVLFDSRAEKLNYAQGRGDAGKNNVLGFDLLSADTSCDWIWRTIDDLENSKLIFMPAVETISDAAAAKLERFVRNGGKLIAVQCSGKADENGNPRTRGALDKLLGIDTSKAVCKSGSFKLVPASPVLAGLKNFSLREMVSGAKLKDAQLLAGTAEAPVITVRKHGRGAAWYVGCDIFQIYSRMTTMRQFKSFAGQVETLQKFMLSLQPERHVAVTTLKGKNAIGVRTVARVLGKAKLITAIDYQDPNMEAPVGLCEDTSKLPQLLFKAAAKGKFFFYDLFSRKKLGEGAAFRSNLKYPGGTLVFSMLPYKPEKVTVTPVKGEGAAFRITSSPHPLLVTVKHNGKPKQAYRQIIPVSKARENKKTLSRTYAFTPGLNEKGGVWELCVEDLFSDQKAVYSFKGK